MSRAVVDNCWPLLHDDDLTSRLLVERSITTNDRRQYRRASGTTITQAHSSSYTNKNIFSALAPSHCLPRPPRIVHSHAAPLTATRCGNKSKISSASASASATLTRSLPALATLPDLLFAAPPSPEDSPPARCVLLAESHEKQ
jgi:hypothetical protein